MRNIKFLPLAVAFLIIAIYFIAFLNYKVNSNEHLIIPPEGFEDERTLPDEFYEK